MQKINVFPVILCGGSGLRLWPLSRSSFPKQFLNLSFNNYSLFQNAVNRINLIKSNDIFLQETLIVTGEEHRFIVLDQLRGLNKVSRKILLEPVSKNTAPALAMAALEAIKNDFDPILVVMPSDHAIEDDVRFANIIKLGIDVASKKNSMVLLGITPTSPETSYGYIHHDNFTSSDGIYDVIGFTEKPCLENAKNLLSKDNFKWNSGIFIVKASLWLKALNFFRGDIFKLSKASFDKSQVDQNFIRPNSNLFKKIPAQSIDHAVIEKLPGSEIDIKMIHMDIKWSDLGSWEALWHFNKKDKYNNVSNDNVYIESSFNNIVLSENRFVNILGVDNLIVIDTSDALLVANRNKSQEVKNLVNKLLQSNRKEATEHRKVLRPWGWYDTIDEGDGFKVKRIQVNPGQKLSLQSHKKRAEHWVVVKGMAEVTCGDKTFNLKKNESTFIPPREIHRLSNPSNSKLLEIIEVQSGSAL